jgi:hypothetical protein
MSKDEYDLVGRLLLDDQEAEVEKKAGRSPRRSFEARREREKRKRNAAAKAKRIGARSAQFNFTTFPELKARFVALSEDNHLPLVEMMERAIRKFIDGDEARKMAAERRERRGRQYA